MLEYPPGEVAQVDFGLGAPVEFATPRMDIVVTVYYSRNCASDADLAVVLEFPAFLQIVPPIFVHATGVHGTNGNHSRVMTIQTAQVVVNE